MNGELLQPQIETKAWIHQIHNITLGAVLYWYVLATCVDVSMVLILFLRLAERFQATLPFRK